MARFKSTMNKLVSLLGHVVFEHSPMVLRSISRIWIWSSQLWSPPCSWVEEVVGFCIRLVDVSVDLSYVVGLDVSY